MLSAKLIVTYESIDIKTVPWLAIFFVILTTVLTPYIFFFRVEFQSKFYKGEGFPFVPLNFHQIISEAHDV